MKTSRSSRASAAAATASATAATASTSTAAATSASTATTASASATATAATASTAAASAATGLSHRLDPGRHRRQLLHAGVPERPPGHDGVLDEQRRNRAHGHVGHPRSLRLRRPRSGRRRSRSRSPPWESSGTTAPTTPGDDGHGQRQHRPAAATASPSASAATASAPAARPPPPPGRARRDRRHERRHRHLADQERPAGHPAPRRHVHDPGAGPLAVPQLPPDRPRASTGRPRSRFVGTVTWTVTLTARRLHLRVRSAREPHARHLRRGQSASEAQEGCVQGSEGRRQEARDRTPTDRPGEVQGRPGAPRTLVESARAGPLAEPEGRREAGARGSREPARQPRAARSFLTTVRSSAAFSASL